MVKVIHCEVKPNGGARVTLMNDVGDEHVALIPPNTPIEGVVGELVLAFNNLHSHELAVRADPHTG